MTEIQQHRQYLRRREEDGKPTGEIDGSTARMSLITTAGKSSTQRQDAEVGKGSVLPGRRDYRDGQTKVWGLNDISRRS